MTANRDFKRLVRSRMAKTGESYTSARMQLLKNSAKTGDRNDGEVSPAPAAGVEASTSLRSPVSGFAQLAGMSDAKVKEATGCAWDKWVWALDKVEAFKWPHSSIVEYVHDKYKVKPWWTQMVTVGYERIKGLREKGQRRGGAYEAGKSKTVQVPVSRLFRAWHDKRTRARWLPGAELTIRTAQKNRSMRITWGDGTAVDLWFQSRGKDKSVVAVTHRKLAGKADAARLKTFWGQRLDALAAMLVPVKGKRAA